MSSDHTRKRGPGRASGKTPTTKQKGVRCSINLSCDPETLHLLTAAAAADLRTISGYCLAAAIRAARLAKEGHPR
jgi:uncharacterized protein (DUF1778 family)